MEGLRPAWFISSRHFALNGVRDLASSSFSHRVAVLDYELKVRVSGY